MGAAYKIKCHQIKGLEALPNIDFWREFPFLVQVININSGWNGIQYKESKRDK